MSLRDRIRRATLKGNGRTVTYTIQDEGEDLIIELREPSYAAKMEIFKAYQDHDGEQPEDAPADDPNKDYALTPIEQSFAIICACCYEPGDDEPLFSMDDIAEVMQSSGDWLQELANACSKVMMGKEGERLLAELKEKELKEAAGDKGK